MTLLQALACSLLAGSVAPDSAPSPPPTTEAGEKHVYGKYVDSKGDNTVNSLWVWKPKSAGSKDSPRNAPAVVYYHPGGFLRGQPYTTSNEYIDSWTNFGFVYISVGYRLTPWKYYYKDTDDSQKLEELVEIAENGDLLLNQAGLTMADWQVYSGYMDMTTKCFFDAAQSIEWIVDNKDLLGIDPMKLVFQSQSAGTGLSNYLTYTYQRNYPNKIHTTALIFTSAQLNYPVGSCLDETLLADNTQIGWETPLADLFDSTSCNTAVGCGGQSEYEDCNQSWNTQRMEVFCDTDGFESKTLGDLYHANIPYSQIPWEVWGAAPGVAVLHRRMGLLWNVEQAMRKYPHGADYVYVSNNMNGTTAFDLPHLSFWARAYANVCEEIDCKYAVYYTDHTAMTPPPSDSVVVYGHLLSFMLGTWSWTKWNYQGNFGWLASIEKKNITYASQEEMVLFGCLAVGMTCNTSRYDFGKLTFKELYEEDGLGFMRRVSPSGGLVATAGAAFLLFTLFFACRRTSYTKLSPLLPFE